MKSNQHTIGLQPSWWWPTMWVGVFKQVHTYYPNGGERIKFLISVCLSVWEELGRQGVRWQLYSLSYFSMASELGLAGHLYLSQGERGRIKFQVVPSADKVNVNYLLSSFCYTFFQGKTLIGHTISVMWNCLNWHFLKCTLSKAFHNMCN